MPGMMEKGPELLGKNRSANGSAKSPVGGGGGGGGASSTNGGLIVLASTWVCVRDVSATLACFLNCCLAP